MKIFDDKDAAKYFYEQSEKLAGQKKEAFTLAVKKAYDAKVTSPQEFSTYKITVQDIKKILAIFI